MVRFCSESLQAVGFVVVFFSCLPHPAPLRGLAPKPLAAAGILALMSVVFGSDPAVLLIFLIRVLVMTFYL